MDAAAIERFMQAQSKAKQLIQRDARGDLNKYTSQARQMAENVMNDAQPQQVMYEQAHPQPLMPQMKNLGNSKLPKEILESMKNNPIDVGPNIVTDSILDRINYHTKGQLFNENKPIAQQTIQETPQISSSTNSIDYSMIKMIVEDCMKKYVNTMKKTIINENKTNNSIDEIQALKIGDKFSFITKNGDLYEAKLTFIKNINNK